MPAETKQRADRSRAWQTLLIVASCLALSATSLSGELLAAPRDKSKSRTKTPPKTETLAPRDEAQAQPKRKPTLLPANKRRSRSSTPPSLTREEPVAPPRSRQAVTPTPLPPAYDPPGDRGPPLGTPPHLDPRLRPAGPPIGYPPLPPTRQVPGETGIPLGVGPLSPVR